MAGGPHAQFVMCPTCTGRAERTSEGIENDQYQCDHCGAFGIDWSYDGPPKKPCWPPTDEELQVARNAIEMMRKAQRQSASDDSGVEGGES